VEEANRLREGDTMPVDEISVTVGYEDASFFRRLFKRRTGLTPGQYRRMFKSGTEIGEIGTDHNYATSKARTSAVRDRREVP